MILNAVKYRSRFDGLRTDIANAHDEVKARLDRDLLDREQAEPELVNF